MVFVTITLRAYYAVARAEALGSRRGDLGSWFRGGVRRALTLGARVVQSGGTAGRGGPRPRRRLWLSRGAAGASLCDRVLPLRRLQGVAVSRSDARPVL